MTVAVQGGGCSCCGLPEAENGIERSAAIAATEPVATEVRVVERIRAAPDVDAAGLSPHVVCTLDGGAAAMRARIGEWQEVISRATGRESASGGASFAFTHDPAVTVELARLAAAEYACCPFFTFDLTVGPDGLRFTVTSPPEAADVVTAVFGIDAADAAAA